MKDFTLIQIEPIPASVLLLQKSNDVLCIQNQEIENLFLTMVLIILVFAVIIRLRNQRKDEDKQ